MPRLKVAILFGGRSAEHEVSILSARNVVAALDPARFEAVPIGIDKGGRWHLQDAKLLLGGPLDPRLARVDEGARTLAVEPVPAGLTGVDVVFPVLHGPMGEDGTVQGLLELADVAYVGAGVLGSAVGMDKDVMKRLLREAGLPVTDFRALSRADFQKDPASVLARAAEVEFPLFTKPANLGSSVGIRRVERREDLETALEYAFRFDSKALAEAAVAGREIECAVLGNHDPLASVVGEVIVHHRDGFYSYDAKYVDADGAVSEIPARIPPATGEQVRALAVRAFRVLECSGLARVDFFLRPDGGIVVNEINTLPGFTAISQYPKLWEASGISSRDLVSRLIDLALERHAERRARLVGYTFTP
jgi:D-alanine-D-alanine ligase